MPMSTTAYTARIGYESPTEVRRRNSLNRSRRMAVAKMKGTHTKQEFEDLKKEFGSRCLKCERKFQHLDRDHIIPIYQGGSDAITNIQPLCAWCNNGKGSETTNWVEYRRLNGFTTIAV